MGIAFVLAYIALNLLSPADMLPDLAAFRPMLLLAILNLPLALLARLQAPEVGKLRTQLVLVLLFFGFACTALIPHGRFGANLETLLEMGPNVLAYFLGIVQFRNPDRLRWARGTLIFIAFFVLIHAFAELPEAYSTGSSSPYVLVQFGIGEYRIRGLGMLQDPNTFAQFLLVILPMLFVAKRDEGLGLKWIPALFTSLIILVGVYFTGSRGGLLGLAVILGLPLMRRFKTLGTVIMSTVGALTLVAVNAYKSRAISVSGGMDRLAIWSDGLAFFKSSPLWGIGPRQFTSQQGMTAHNSFLLVAAEMGLIGFFLWMSMIVVTLIQLNRIPALVEQSNPSLARWAKALRTSLGCYLFTSFFLSRAYELPLFMLLGMCGGVIVAAGGDDAVPLRGSHWPLWTLVLCGALLTLIYILLRLRAV